MSDDSDSDSDEFMGPSIVAVEDPVEVEIAPSAKKRKLKPPSEYLELNQLYQNSYQNESVITVITATPDQSIVATGHINGSVKFWKMKSVEVTNTHDQVEQPAQLECVKQYNVHKTAIAQLLINRSGSTMCSVAEGDSSLSIFDLKTLDMLQVVKLDFTPNTSSVSTNSWFTVSNEDRILVGEQDSVKLFVVIPENNEFESIPAVHKSPLQSAIFNYKFQCFVTSDQRGIMEYWSPSNAQLEVSFKYKSETDLFVIAKSKSKITFAQFSQDEQTFAAVSSPDNQLRIFDFTTGKVTKTLQTIPDGTFTLANKHLIYVNTQGIEILDLESDEVVTLLGEEDQKIGIQFNQTILMNKLDLSGVDHHKISSNNSIVREQLTKKLLVVASAIKSTKLFIFGKSSLEERDIDYSIKKRKSEAKTVFKTATLHTTLGDITIKLYGNLVPKTVENFTKLCEINYYNNIIFHRVIKGFMIQTGDPKGDGTGGESAWGGHFKDEFSRLLTHAKPFMVSMANAGPNTNGSQFFITTGSATHLDNKHSVFGEVVKGFDTVRQIEARETDDSDIPLEQVAILSTSLA